MGTPKSAAFEKPVQHGGTHGRTHESRSPRVDYQVIQVPEEFLFLATVDEEGPHESPKFQGLPES